MFLTTSPQRWRRRRRWILLSVRDIKPTMSGNFAKAQQCPLIGREQKLGAVRNHPSGAKQRGFIVLPSLHLSSTTPSSCCAGLAERRGFLFWFLCWRSKFPGMWNQRRRCHVPPLPPSTAPQLLFILFPSSPLRDGELHISSSMRNGSERLGRGGVDLSA